MDKKTLRHIIMDELDFNHEFDGIDALPDIMDKQRELMNVLRVPIYISGREQVISKSNPRHGAIKNRIEKQLACMSNEIEEIRDWLPWKDWKNYGDDAPIDLEEIRLECIDLFHFLLELMICLGMYSCDIHRYYVSKWEENIERQKRGY